MVKAIIVDDELRARDSLAQMLNVYCPSISLVGSADGIQTAYQLIISTKPDLVFLDMQLVDGHGFDLLKKFETIPFKVIIISAYQEYAVKAFKFSAVDYLLKPIDPDDLVKAVDEAINLSFYEKQQERLNALIENTNNQGGKKRLIALKNSEGIFIVNTNEIIRCESDNNTTTFILNNSARVRATKTLKEFEELLSECGFIRCHQSHLINQIHIEKISRFPTPSITLSNGDVVPVSFRKRKIL